MDIATLTIPEAIRLYVGVRDARDEKNRAHEAAIAPLETLLEDVAAKIQAYMNAEGLKSVPTDFGTAVQITKTNATVGDWDAFYAFLIQTGRLDFLQKRVASTALAEYAEEAAVAPPGVSFFTERKVQVRRPKS
jgi:hypothetical protein